MSDDTPEAAAVKHSHPEWLVRMWWDQLGADETRELLARDNEPPESSVRVNTLRAETLDLPVPAHPAPGLPEGLVLDAPLDVHGTDAFERGLLMPQSRGSMTVARVLDPQPGERVLDLCAAPGGKTTHLAALLGNDGEVIAIEKHGGRAKALAENCERMGATSVSVREADAADVDGEYDRVLLDPPCSDLGTLQARPDVRWKKDVGIVARLVEEQSRLLDSAAERVRPGGTLVYSTCTISPEENERQVAAFLERRDDFGVDELPDGLEAYAHQSADGLLQVLPHRHGTDGFFIARLARAL
jgi:16S rRNA (cytosine967-C5)-methyltransferase